MLAQCRCLAVSLALALALAALTAAALPRAAQAGALDELRAFLVETRAARGRFTQKLLHDDARVADSSHGVFAFARPGRFRWEVREPFEQLLVADGEQLHFYDKDLNQVTVRSLKDALDSTPAAILFGSADLERGFVLRELPARDGLAWLEALPRNQETGFERIEFGFRDGLPVQMQVHDSFGRTTRFEFSEIERVASLPADLFRFAPPPGVDVVRQ